MDWEEIILASVLISYLNGAVPMGGNSLAIAGFSAGVIALPFLI